MKRYKNKKEARLILRFFEEQGWLCDESENYAEFQTWTDGGVNIVISLDKMTFEELSLYLDSVDCDEEIDLLRKDERYRKKFTLKQSVEDIYGFYCRLDEEWDKFLVFHKK